MKEYIANNLRELISIVNDLYPRGKYYLWYRGHLNAQWELVPSVQRGSYAANEQHMAIDFYMRASVALKEKPPPHYLPGWVALMQHYGLPTRLLDWSKSLLVATFFATYRYEDQPGKDGCIWILRPGQLNLSEGLGDCISPMDSPSITELLAVSYTHLDVYKRQGIPREEMKQKENNCEIYFEFKDFDAFLKKLESHQEINLLHAVREQPWGQRVIRFYDPDQHLIEVGESMKSLAEKYLAAGMTLEEAAARMDVQVSDVQKMLTEAD